MFLEEIELDRQAAEPLHRQLASALRARIEAGTLAAGGRLPATRDLARSLGVTRGTVQRAYRLLVAAGLARAHVGQGTFVGGRPDAELPAPPVYAFGSRAGEDAVWDRLAVWAARPGMISFAGGLPDARLFPVAPLKESLDAALDEEGPALLQYGASRGYPPFLSFLRRHLARRGIDATDDNLLVVSGSQQGLDLIARALIAPGDAVVVENPTYSGALALFRILGARLLPVPVDGDGLRVDLLERLLAVERPKLVYTIPTFHNPTGVTLSRPRREELVAICRAARVPLVEDDSDGELRFAGDELPRLASLPGAGGVIYLGALSKLFFPGLRLGWVVAEPATAARLEATKRVTDLHTPPLLQAALARFAASTAGVRLARDLRERYRSRRDALLAALEADMPDGVTWTRPDGGLSLTVDVGAGLDTTDLLRRAADEGVLFAPGALFAADGGGRSTLRLTYGTVEENEIETGITRLARALAGEMEAAGVEAGRRLSAAMPPPV